MNSRSFGCEVLEAMKIRSPVLVQGYNLAVDNSVGGKVVEGFSDLRKSLVETKKLFDAATLKLV